LEDAVIPVHVTATDVEGVAVLLSKGPALDAIMASAAIPGIFPPVRIDGRSLMDGAIAANTPIKVAADLGASRIVVLPTGYAIARALHAITLLIEWQLIRDLERLTGEIHISIVPTLCPLDVSPYDFSASHYLIQRAADSTRKWVDGGGLSRQSSPQELQAHSH
jgi:NTE family protein